MIRSRLVVVLFFICLLLLCVAGFFQPRSIFFHTPPAAMSITHTVLFQIKADAKPEDVKAVRTILVHQAYS